MRWAEFSVLVQRTSNALSQDCRAVEIDNKQAIKKKSNQSKHLEERNALSREWWCVGIDTKQKRKSFGWGIIRWADRRDVGIGRKQPRKTAGRTSNAFIWGSRVVGLHTNQPRVMGGRTSNVLSRNCWYKHRSTGRNSWEVIRWPESVEVLV